MNRPTARRPAGARTFRSRGGREQGNREQGAAADPNERHSRRTGSDESAVRRREAAGGAASWETAGRGRAARTRTTRADAPTRARTAPVDTPVRGQRPTDTDAAADAPPKRARFAGLLRRPRRAATSGPRRRPVPARYRRRRLVAGLAVAVALFVGVGLGSRVLLYDLGVADVQDVTVTGLSTVPEQVVRDAAAVSPGGPLISVDTAGVAQRVAAVEGVAAVEVRRAWPHTVEVEVTERVPVALWQGPQGLTEVDGTGLPYRRAPQPPPGLPLLAFSGVGPQDPATAAALAVLHDLTDPLRAQVATVDAAGTQVTLGLTEGRSVRWGGTERAADKTAVLAALLGQPGTVYDVSSPDLPTVRR